MIVMNEKRLIDATTLLNHLSVLSKENPDMECLYRDFMKIVREMPIEQTNLDAKLEVLNLKDNDVLIVKIDIDSYSVKEIQEIADCIKRRVDCATLFVSKDVDFSVKSKNLTIENLQMCIDRLRGDTN